MILVVAESRGGRLAGYAQVVVVLSGDSAHVLLAAQWAARMRSAS